MWWMNARARRVAEERGAMALIVAIVVPVLLLGLGALVVDVGGWYAGRAQDQNGADAAVVAVADSCSTGACDTSLASKYIDSATSPNGDLAHAYTACGDSPLADGSQDPGLISCASQGVPEDGKACPLPPSSNYVDILATPKNTDGSNTITSLFGEGKQSVGACAQAGWGPAMFPGGGIALTISYCEWSYYTNNGDSSKYAASPPWPGTNPWPTTPEEKLQFKGDGSSVGHTCPTGASGGTPISGGFASTDPTTKKGCITDTGSDGWYGSQPGNGIQNCDTTLHDDWTNQTVVLIPVFDNTEGSGNSGLGYHLSTLAAFVVTAWYDQAGNGGDCSLVPGSPYAGTGKNGACQKKDPAAFCPNGNGTGASCLIGYFVQATDDTGDPGKGAGTGVVVPPKLIG
jgi:hypothetical protein